MNENKSLQVQISTQVNGSTLHTYHLESIWDEYLDGSMFVCV